MNESLVMNKNRGNIKKTIDNGDFLQIDNWCNREYCGIDTYDRYQRNLQTQPSDWLWRTKRIKYNFNNDGYRCPEWENIDWSASIILFNGSGTTGMVSKLLGRSATLIELNPLYIKIAENRIEQANPSLDSNLFTYK